MNLHDVPEDDCNLIAAWMDAYYGGGDGNWQFRRRTGRYPYEYNPSRDGTGWTPVNRTGYNDWLRRARRWAENGRGTNW